MCSRCARAVLAVCSRCARGVFALCSRCARGVLAVCSRCARGVHLRIESVKHVLLGFVFPITLNRDFNLLFCFASVFLKNMSISQYVFAVCSRCARGNSKFENRKRHTHVLLGFVFPIILNRDFYLLFCFDSSFQLHDIAFTNCRFQKNKFPFIRK